MMSMHRLGQRIERTLDEILERGLLNSGDVVLRWNDAPAASDPNDESLMGTPTPREQTVTALIYYVSAKSVPNGFMVFDKVDAILTFDSRTDLSKMNGLTYELPDGLIYVPANTGGKAVEFWETVVQGKRLARTVAVKKL